MSGWIDLQINGWDGVDFSARDLTSQSAAHACAAIRSTGTAGFLATMITSPLAVYERNLPILAALTDPTCLGIHLEGPFFDPTGGALGVHAPAHCQIANPDLLSRWQDLAHGRIRLLTIGADVPEAPGLTAAACRLGMIVSLGHHLADAAQITACADAGATALTHLGNGLPMQIHRHHNPIWAGLAENRLFVMVIADGHHLPPPVLRVIARVAGERLILVSDAAPLAGCAPGRYRCFGRDVELTAAGALRDVASAGFAGSVASLGDCVHYGQQLGLHDLDAAARKRPLALLGMRV